MKILVTGGAGFIGSAVIRHLIGNTDATVVNVDKLACSESRESHTAIAAELVSRSARKLRNFLDSEIWMLAKGHTLWRAKSAVGSVGNPTALFPCGRLVSDSKRIAGIPDQ